MCLELWWWWGLQEWWWGPQTKPSSPSVSVASALISLEGWWLWSQDGASCGAALRSAPEVSTAGVTVPCMGVVAAGVPPIQPAEPAESGGAHDAIPASYGGLC